MAKKEHPKEEKKQASSKLSHMTGKGHMKSEIADSEKKGSVNKKKK